MLRVNGEDTSWPFLGLVMIVCVNAGIAAMVSAKQAQERVRIKFIFIENSS
jgi:hypothetical protein